MKALISAFHIPEIIQHIQFKTPTHGQRSMAEYIELNTKINYWTGQQLP